MARLWIGVVCVAALACGNVRLSLDGGRSDASDARDAAAARADAAVLADASEPTTDLTVWPNAHSTAASDPWIAAHHREIREIHPRVIALNFVNGRTNAEMNGLLAQIFAGLAEGSRYHGYANPGAPAFLHYELVRAIDLTDHPAPAGYRLRNSTRYPRKPASSSDDWHFNYGALFSAQFADYYGFPDPARPGRNLPLCELLQRGIVHEIWIYGDADTPGDVNAAEILEVKQRYDAQDRALAGQFDPCAGNGCMDASDLPGCGVSFRIPWVNHSRGPGCLVHSLGHGFESLSGGAAHRPAAIPYLAANFLHFANFDLRDRQLAPFQSWYDQCGPDCVEFTGPNALTWRDDRQNTGAIAAYDQGCGSVHFPPNARAHYDDQNSVPVLSTCEHFGLHDGPDGRDLAELYTSAKSRRYDALQPDCGGGWQVYWRQSFPGYGNLATDATGAPMKNWWVYQYY